VYITESIARQIDIRCADGYLEEYDEFDIEIVKDLAPYLKDAVSADIKAEAAGLWKGLVEDFVYESRTMATVLDEALNVSKYDCNVLISGETGVGKDKIATIIQKNSVRKMQPFIKINCAAIAPNLLESEFFGYEKGSFTGASVSGKKGYFELADNGTILLDEIGELSAEMQAKLLRVVQDGEFYKVGGTYPVKTNVRVLSATNRNIEDMVEKKLFRRDLYYRLNVFPPKIPSLRERNEDVPVLIAHFIIKYSDKFNIKREIEEDAANYLKQYEWPGNIRELENVIQRLLINAKSEIIYLHDVMKELNSDIFSDTLGVPPETGIAGDTKFSLNEMVGDYEKGILKLACEKYGSTRKTAKALGVSQTQLIRKKKIYGI